MVGLVSSLNGWFLDFVFLYLLSSQLCIVKALVVGVFQNSMSLRLKFSGLHVNNVLKR